MTAPIPEIPSLKVFRVKKLVGLLPQLEKLALFGWWFVVPCWTRQLITDMHFKQLISETHIRCTRTHACTHAHTHTTTHGQAPMADTLCIHSKYLQIYWKHTMEEQTHSKQDCQPYHRHMKELSLHFLRVSMFIHNSW